MQLTTPPSRLDRLVDHKTEHVRGPRDTEIAVFVASVLSAVMGTILLWGESPHELSEEAPQSVFVNGS
jgi:hypothetical protein